MKGIGEYTHEICIAKTTIKGGAIVPKYLELDKWYPFKKDMLGLGWYYNENFGGNWVYTHIKGSLHLNGGNFKLRKRKDVQSKR